MGTRGWSREKASGVEKDGDTLYDRGGRNHPPMAEDREEAPQGWTEREPDSEARREHAAGSGRGGIIDADMCSSLGGSNP